MEEYVSKKISTEALDSVVNEINKEVATQQQALAVENGKTTTNATFSEVFWLNPEAARAEQGLGARFMLRQVAKGVDVSEYTLQLGSYVRTKAQRFHRLKDSGKYVDLSISEWRLLLEHSQPMMDKLIQLKKVESERYVLVISVRLIKVRIFQIRSAAGSNAESINGALKCGEGQFEKASDWTDACRRSIPTTL